MNPFAHCDCWYDIGLLTFTLLLGLYTYPPSRIAPPEAAAKAQSKDTLTSMGVVRTDALGRLWNFALRTAGPLWSLAGLCTYAWSLQTAADKVWIQRALRVGCTITIVGHVGRLICFHTLGKFFTFNLAVHSDHKIVRSGPYAYVRHPGYTTAILTWIGRLFTGFLGNPCITPHWRLPMFALGILELVLWMGFVSRRIQEEEAMLKREMGKEYVAYMKDVPARLVPGLL